MKLSAESFGKAQTFIYENARLLDRKLFEHHFAGGSAEAVIAVLRAYQNDDGGFGNALEADIRCPESQPVATEAALLAMDGIGLYDEAIVRGIVRFLERIALESGGFPRACTGLEAYPHAPWWSGSRTDVAAMNPTGRIVALLLKMKCVPLCGPVAAPGAATPGASGAPDWFARAVAYVWANLDQIDQTFYHDLIQSLAFLEQTGDKPRAAAALAELDRWLSAPGVIEHNPQAEGYVHKLLDWAPTPDSYCAKFVDAATVSAHLDALVQGQQADGGWPLAWQALSPAATMEWRGAVTVQRLVTLKAYGRL